MSHGLRQRPKPQMCIPRVGLLSFRTITSASSPPSTSMRKRKKLYRTKLSYMSRRVSMYTAYEWKRRQSHDSME